MADILPMEPVYLEAEVAEMLRVDIQVIRRERYAGRLGYTRVGGQVRIRKSDLERYVRERSCHVTPLAPGSPAGPARPSGTSHGQTGEAELDGARRGREIARSLKPPSPRSS